jgi:hypothetical protein
MASGKLESWQPGRPFPCMQIYRSRLQSLAGNLRNVKGKSCARMNQHGKSCQSHRHLVAGLKTQSLSASLSSRQPHRWSERKPHPPPTSPHPCVSVTQSRLAPDGRTVPAIPNQQGMSNTLLAWLGGAHAGLCPRGFSWAQARPGFIPPPSRGCRAHGRPWHRSRRGPPSRQRLRQAQLAEGRVVQ